MKISGKNLLIRFKAHDFEILSGGKTRLQTAGGHPETLRTASGGSDPSHEWVNGARGEGVLRR